jgi:hypothetical protein
MEAILFYVNKKIDKGYGAAILQEPDILGYFFDSEHIKILRL